MKTHRHIINGLCLAAVLAVSCETEPVPGGLSEDLHVPAPSGKIVHTKSGSDPSTVLFKLNTADDAASLAGIASSGLVNVSRLFNSTPGKEELEARFGLDRWYVAQFGGTQDIDEVVNVLASMATVELVEYNVVATKASDCIAYPYEGPEPDTKASTGGSDFNDPSLGDQWHYYNQGNASIATTARKGADINVKDVWRELTCGDPSIIIAVVDEGVKHTHPDLKDNMWTNTGEIPDNGIDDDGNGYVDDVHGYNFVTGGAIDWTDDEDTGHGTHCAGTIAAVNNNGIGVAGVAGGNGKGDGCRIMSCQIFSGSVGGSTSLTCKAIKYAADNGASIISCSFGYTSAYSSDNDYLAQVGSAEIDAIHYFEASCNNDVLDGNIAVFASGNDAHDYSHYPGAYNDIISVTAFGPDYLPTYYTNYGPGCNISAPGGEAYLAPWKTFKAMVLSTLPSEVTAHGATSSGKGFDYGYMQGTSMACPHVSGVVALGLSYARKLGKKFDRERFKDMVVSSANGMDQYLKGTKSYVGRTDLNLAQFYHKLGTGAIDAWQLMMQIEGIPCLTAELGRNQWLDLSDHFGSASTSLTYLGVEISEDDKAALGLAQDPYIEYGRLYIHPTKTGAAKFKVTAVGGGDVVGGGDNVGGMEISQEISVIVRSFSSSNGGWL